MPRTPKEPISVTTDWHGQRVKISRTTIEKLQADVEGPKRFYTQQWLDEYLKRFTVVRDCDCGEPLIAEEVDSHGFKHLDPRLRPILRMYMDLDDDDRATVREFVAASH
jgi:hypothetical protein